MNETFRQMADQMKPSPELTDDLAARLDEIDELAKPRPVVPRSIVVPSRSRRRVVSWVAAAACVVAAASVGVWALGSEPPIMAADPAVAAGPGDAPPAAGPSLPEASLAPVAEYDELYQTISTTMTRWGTSNRYYGDSNTGSDPLTAAVPDTATTATRNSDTDQGGLTGGAPSYTATNVQVAGIDEGDIVKTDGKVLYVASGTRVSVLIPDGAETRKVAGIETASADSAVSGAVLDLMLSGNTLVVFVQDYAVSNKTIDGNQPVAYVAYDVTGTRAVLYDVTDPAKPKLTASLGQSGAYSTSRLVGHVLYLVTDYELTDPAKVMRGAPATYVPQLIDGQQAVPLPAGDISSLKEPQQARYAVATAVDVRTGTRLGQQAVLAGADTTYMSEDNLFLAARLYDVSLSAAQRKAAGEADLANSMTTTIVRINLNGGALSMGAQSSVPGTLLNQFAMDELNGHLRVVTDLSGETVGGQDKSWVQRVGLFVLDSKLAIVGKLPKLVENETVQSVRFEGKIGYVVTYRQRDPLFAINLSTPSKPTVMSALKIPGFSAYLHPWANGRLLGVGVDATDSGKQTGLKLSMFDTHDPYKVTELTTKHLSGNDSEAFGDHKAVLVDPDRGLIGFPVLSRGANDQTVRYALYTYSADKGFVLKQDLALPSATQWTRGVLVGDFLYLCTDQQVEAYSLGSGAKAAGVKLG